ncbi:MAG: glycoside hydrolase family 32 protein, partial [Planctomycetota bacterium]
MRKAATCLILALCWGTTARAAGDILIADFEGKDYGEWEATGDCFGNSPARGTLPGQQRVTGFKGKGLVNTFLKRDGSTGTLTSPEFTIERKYIVFLIGGGAHRNTCMQLLVGGKVVDRCSGADDELLTPNFFDVQKHRGKTARLRIVDENRGGWGHVNVDQIVQSDTKPKKPKTPKRGGMNKEFTVSKKYLIMPIKNGRGGGGRITLEIDGKAVRRYGLVLAPGPDHVDWWAFFTIESYKGRSATVSASRATEEGFALVEQADEVPGSETWYTEALRPQFHFSQVVGWNNDPNGMVYFEGEWHLYFQHNPVGWGWGNMTWGHAVSKDLVHWEQLPNALFPGTMARGACFSGSATIDKMNTAGWGRNLLVAFLTDTGAGPGEAVAYSRDRGRTFTWYEGNPVVKHKGRDPKVIWYAYDAKDEPLDSTAGRLGGHWVMTVYDEHKQYKRNAAFYTSTDLKKWKEQSHLPGYFECTELFELPVDGDKTNTRWVVFAADARYAVGQFDGKVFKPEHQGKHRVHYGNYYASQTFDNPPDGRKIQIGWARIGMPGMPFNQAFSFPHRLTLRKTPAGVRMYAAPVKEIELIHKRKHSAADRFLNAGGSVSLPVSGELFDVRATFEIGNATSLGLDIGGNRVTYDVGGKKLNGAQMEPVDGKVTIQV